MSQLNHQLNVGIKKHPPCGEIVQIGEVKILVTNNKNKLNATAGTQQVHNNSIRIKWSSGEGGGSI